MGKEDIAASGDHPVENGHDFRKRLCKTRSGDVAALPEIVPVDRVVFPALKRHLCQEIGGSWPVFGRIEIETRHKRYVDDPAAQLGLRRRQLLGVERPQRVVLVAPPDGDPDNLHSCPLGFIEQSGSVSAAEQFAEKDENIAFTEDRVFGKTIQCNRIFHLSAL